MRLALLARGVGAIALCALVLACGRMAAPAQASFAVLTPDGRVLHNDFFHEVVRAVARRKGDGTYRRLSIEPDSSAGTLTIGLPAPTEEAYLWVAGCKEIPLPARPSASPLQLEYGPRVRFRVHAKGGLPKAPMEVRLEFRWRGSGTIAEAPYLHDFSAVAPEGGIPHAFESATTSCVVSAEHPEVVAHASRAGPYRMTWGVFDVRKTGPHSTTASGVTPDGVGRTVFLPDSPTEAVVDVELEEPQLSEAVARFTR